MNYYFHGRAQIDAFFSLVFAIITISYFIGTGTILMVGAIASFAFLSLSALEYKMAINHVNDQIRAYTPKELND